MKATSIPPCATGSTNHGTPKRRLPGTL
jgi:hypothetical protein